MAMKLSPILARIAYGAIFTMALPLGLWLWSLSLNCPFRGIQSGWGGGILLATGLMVMLSGMWRLWREGGGLPMNAFPPPRVAARGIYGIIPHPIYCGFVIGCAGVALLTGSASTLWMVTPLTAVGCFALVVGYEGPNLKERFGAQLPEPWLGIPRDNEGCVSLQRRFGTMLAVLIPFAVSYMGIKAMGVSEHAEESRQSWEWQIAIWPSTMPMYASIYFVVPLTFLLVREKREQRRLAIATLVAIGLNTLVYLTVPVTAVFRPGQDAGWLGQWLEWEQRMAEPAAGSFPAFHATWAVICAATLVRRKPHRRLDVPIWIWCAGLCLSCLTTGMHSVADVLAGAATGIASYRAPEIWRFLIKVTEKLGNQWSSWQFGPLRVISHSVWSGLAGVCLFLMVGISTDPADLGWVLFVAVCALVGAGLWAQWVEGSSALLRPFGYYGAVLGGLIAFATAAVLRGPVLELLAGFAFAAPWTQAIGRVRCIVQGCCHGRPVPWGIRITNGHSRVVKLAGFTGTPIHPTPLYSVISCAVIGLILMRLRFAGADAFQIGGIYLVLAGLTRFVEEGYRGEPQTARFAGLALYQWMAVGSLALGMVLLDFHSGSALPRLHRPGTLVLALSVAWGLICAFAMSMDFPKSNRRFSRLTG